MLEVQSWTVQDYLAVRELSVIGPVQGLQCIPAAAHRLLWSIVGNKAKARALFSNSLHVDMGFFFPPPVVSPLSLKIPNLMDYWLLKTGYRIWVQWSQIQRLTANHVPLSMLTHALTVQWGSITSIAAYRPHGKCHWSIYWASLLETAAYGKSMELPPAPTTTGAVSHCWARKYPHKPQWTLKPWFHVLGVLMASD